MVTTNSYSNVTRLNVEPEIIPQGIHGITDSRISENALRVLHRLKNAGYKAYLVGGCVRDLLLGIQPKDFDVVTDARPEQIRELFRNCHLIGRRFRLAHVRFGKEIIEVSTFRAPHYLSDDVAHTKAGRIIFDNVYGDINDDIWRRDFTVNALFYNIEDYSITDYVGAINDIKNKKLRLIGKPKERYREDPVRMLRAIRFAAKLDFEIHGATEETISLQKHLLKEIPPARLFEEFQKLFMSGHALASYNYLLRYKLFEYLCPQTSKLLDEKNNTHIHNLLSRAFQNTDTRLATDLSVTPAYLLAAILWVPLRRLIDESKSNGLDEIDALQLASDTVISRQVSSLAMPRRFSRVAREIWLLQARMKNIKGKKPYRVLAHPRFRAAYDFLLLRTEVGEETYELADWWKEFQDNNFEKYGHKSKSEHSSRDRKYRNYRKHNR